LTQPDAGLPASRFRFTGSPATAREERLTVKDFLLADSSVVRGAHAGDGPDYTLEAIAVRVSADITQTRQHGHIPAHTRTLVTILPASGRSRFRVEGFDTIPDKATTRAVMTALFEMASSHNNHYPRRRDAAVVHAAHRAR
jgi:hypothetical protein